jgi:spore photoproduct lyase family protein
MSDGATMMPETAMPTRESRRLANLLDIGRIYLEPAVHAHARGREILARFPEAELIEVASHWRIPELFGNEGAARDWVRNKRTVLVLGVKKAMTIRPNGRSADYIAPGASNGCALACVYCYVPRRKGFANPITTFVNIGQICAAIERHAAKLGPRTEPGQTDPHRWVYDIGENGDASVDDLIGGNVRDQIELFRRLPNAKGSFATKYVNRDLLAHDPQGGMRIRFSMLPHRPAKLLDVRSSPMSERIRAVDDFVRAGWEVHLNFSPVVVYEGWTADYIRLFEELNDALSPAAKAQAKAEVIFLTHNADLHDVNLHWHPKAEDMLWSPRLQETKRSENGQENLRYRAALKARMVRMFLDLMAEHLPWCPVRYAF